MRIIRAAVAEGARNGKLMADILFHPVDGLVEFINDLMHAGFIRHAFIGAREGAILVFNPNVDETVI